MRSRFQHFSWKQWTRSKSQFSNELQWNTVFSSLERFPLLFWLAIHTGLLNSQPGLHLGAVSHEQGVSLYIRPFIFVPSALPKKLKPLCLTSLSVPHYGDPIKQSTLLEHGLTNPCRVTHQQCSHLELVDISSFVKYGICFWPLLP